MVAGVSGMDAMTLALSALVLLVVAAMQMLCPPWQRSPA
jgi:hypothetical protein